MAIEPGAPGIISRYFPHLSPYQLKQFSDLEKLYFSWNEKINLVSRKDIEHLTERHILHSLSIAKVIGFKPGTKILDIGTGGGFPGIPLAIMFPDSQFYLVDSIGKKIKVVKELIQSLELKNAGAENARVEGLKQQFDFAVCRAVAPVPELLHWLRGKILKKNFNRLANGLLCFKGGDLTEELKDVKNRTLIYNISDFFEEDFFKTKKIVYVEV